jgi:hypothetical protein
MSPDPPASHTRRRMQSVAFCLPLVADEAEGHRRALLSCWVGERREAHRDACRRAGITREGVWIQAAADGPAAVVYLEADDVENAMRLLASSTEPFDRWFRGQVRRAHGQALDVGAAGAERALDFDIHRTG